MKLWISYFLHDAFPLVTRFFFCKKFDFLKKTWNRHLFLFCFFKEKQNKKENPKCDSIFGKKVCGKPKSGPESSYLLDRYGGEP